MKKRYGVLVAIVVIAVLVGFGAYWMLRPAETGVWTAQTITQANVATVISRTNVVQDIPSDGVIELYIGEEAYTLRQGSMSSGAAEHADITVRIPESYLEIMGQYGPCAALAQARANQELSIELKDSSTTLAWKYKELAKYRSCLG